MSFIASFKWHQAPFAVPIGLCVAILIMGWKNLWNTAVEVLRIVAVFIVDYIIEPLRHYFSVVLDAFEYYALNLCIYSPLVRIGLLKDVEFLTFCRMLYVCIALAFLLLLWCKLPPISKILFSGGRLRKCWIKSLLITAFFVCLFGGLSVHMRGYALPCYVIEAFALAFFAAFFAVKHQYPSTNDGAELFGWLSLPAPWSEDPAPTAPPAAGAEPSLLLAASASTRRSTRRSD